METTLAFTINPSAGLHAISSSPLEIEAARRATERSVRRFAYYAERYGERGRRFGDSDGAWLATLCRGEEAYVERQVLWLGHVLASRGMPRWLLAEHLDVLHAELVRASPSDAECYRLLGTAAAGLRSRENRHIPAVTARRLAERFAEEADPERVLYIPEMGRILVAAVADEADGIENAVRSVESWAGDPSRFSEAWCNAVRHTVQRARSHIAGSG
jgi:hypothetical protein